MAEPTQIVLVASPEAAEAAAVHFPASLVRYANGQLPAEAADFRDAVIIGTDGEWITTACEQLAALQYDRIRFANGDISEIDGDALEWVRARIQTFTAPAPQSLKPADTSVPPAAATKAKPETAAAGLPADQRGGQYRAPDEKADAPSPDAVRSTNAGSPDEPPHEPAGSDWGEFPPVEAYAQDAAEESALRGQRNASALKREAHEDGKAYEWPEPADFWASRPLPPFDPDWITPAVRPFVLNAAACVGCDPGITYLQALAFAAGCLSDEIKVRVRPNQDWAESARLWAMVVGESGDGKSPSMRAIMREAGQLSIEVAQRSKEKHAAYQDEKDLYKRERDIWLDKRTKGDPAGPRPIEPPRPVNELLYFSGTTSEGLLEQQEATTRGTMLYSDELVGWLFSMDQFKAGGKGSDRQFWLSAWDGAEYVGILVGKLRTIPNTGVTIIGGAQPHAIRAAVAKMSLDSDGLLQRVLVYNSSGEAREENEQPADREAILRWRSILHNLYAMKPHLDHCVFSDKAHAIRSEANEWIGKMRSVTGLPDSARQALSKWRAYLPRIALTMHAIEAAANGADVIPARIEEHTMLCAWAYMRDCLWPNLLKLYSILSEDGGETRGVRGLAEYLLARDIRSFKPHFIASNWAYYRHNFKTIAQRREFFAQAESCGWLRPFGQIDRNKGTAAEYQVNPAAFDGRFAEAAMAAQAAVEAYRQAMHPAMTRREPGED